MYPIAILLIFLWLVQMVSSQAEIKVAEVVDYKTERHLIEVVELGKAAKAYYAINGVYPSSLSVLYAADGFEYVKSFDDVWHQVSTSLNKTDVAWTYDRWGVINTDGRYVQADYLAENACGTGNFTSSASWCGKNDGAWFQLESKDNFNSALNSQYTRQNLFKKTLQRYSAKVTNFPDKDFSNSLLAVNSVTDIAALVNYAGTAANCSGQFAWMGIGIDCETMFDRWGGKTTYKYIASDHVVITSTSPIKNAAGVAMTVETDVTPDGGGGGGEPPPEG